MEGPKAQWLKLAHHLQHSLSGQESLFGRFSTGGSRAPEGGGDSQESKEATRRQRHQLKGGEVEEARQAGTVHVGHQIWRRLGLPERVCYFEQFEDQAGWQKIVREPSPRNEGQHEMRVLLKQAHFQKKGSVNCPDSKPRYYWDSSDPRRKADNDQNTWKICR